MNKLYNKYVDDFEDEIIQSIRVNYKATVTIHKLDFDRTLAFANRIKNIFGYCDYEIIVKSNGVSQISFFLKYPIG